MMSETDYRLVSLSIGIIGAFFGAGIGVFLFAWKESRARFQRKLSGARGLVILLTAIEEQANHSGADNIELKLELLIAGANNFLESDSAMNVIRSVIKVVAEARERVRSAPDTSLTDLAGKLTGERIQAEKILHSYSRSIKRILLLT
jgi:hypothetical protein